MVTMVSQDLSEFALHVRAILGLPIPEITQRGPSASAVILVEGDGEGPCFRGVDTALAVSGVDVRLFGKPEVIGKRRMGVCIARADQVADARKNATTAAEAVRAVTANGEPWPG